MRLPLALGADRVQGPPGFRQLVGLVAPRRFRQCRRLIGAGKLEQLGVGHAAHVKRGRGNLKNGHSRSNG